MTTMTARDEYQVITNLDFSEANIESAYLLVNLTKGVVEAVFPLGRFAEALAARKVADGEQS